MIKRKQLPLHLKVFFNIIMLGKSPQRYGIDKDKE